MINHGSVYRADEIIPIQFHAVDSSNADITGATDLETVIRRPG